MKHFAHNTIHIAYYMILTTLHSHIGFWINYNLLSYAIVLGKQTEKHIFVSHTKTRSGI